MKNYIFGYGSLINKNSIQNTSTILTDLIPISVKGLRRGWYFCDKAENRSAVGVEFDDDFLCNGVLFEVPRDCLNSFDSREAGYKRVKLDFKNIEFLSRNSILSNNIWVYALDKISIPDDKDPIAQSYVDTVIAGCLNFGEFFTKDFISTTKGWENTWINDRKNPRFKSGDKNISYEKIDSILESFIPEKIKNRKEVK